MKIDQKSFKKSHVGVKYNSRTRRPISQHTCSNFLNRYLYTYVHTYIDLKKFKTNSDFYPVGKMCISQQYRIYAKSQTISYGKRFLKKA